MFLKGIAMGKVLVSVGLVVCFWGGICFSAGTEVVYLSGKGRDDAVLWEFYCTGGRRSGEWSKIAVPSCWELEGFGEYNYGLHRVKADEQGRYRRKFEVPTEWAGRRIRIVFEGVMTDAEVRVNGQSAGDKHQGAFYRFKYDITDLVKVGGENSLEVLVSKQPENHSVYMAERLADYWVFGGIYRPVYLEAVPSEHIEWVAVDARANGSFRVDVHVQAVEKATDVWGEIFESNGDKLSGRFSATVSPGMDKVRLDTKVRGHRRWSAETPELYEVRLTLGRNGKQIHTVRQRFGFRTVEVRAGEGIFLNGRKICLKGVNRHCFWPDSGRTVDSRLSFDDVQLIKDMNMNAVRMSHYPPDVHFLDACDELGLYVLDELGGWGKGSAYETKIGRTLVKEMVARDVSHPCVIFWDNGNEGGWNQELDADFGLYDPQRRTVLHPSSGFFGPTVFNDIDTTHYPDYDKLKQKLSADALVMPTEFLHGLYDGGHGAGLQDYWDLIRSSLVGAGGFLWVFADEGIVRTDAGGFIDVDGSHAPDGIVGPYREKEASFYTIKEIWSPIHVGLEKISTDFDGQIEVENRYDFTNLRQCEFEWKLAKFVGPWDKQSGHRVLWSRSFSGPNVAAGDKGILELDLPDEWRRADVLYLTAGDPFGREVWTWSWEFRDDRYWHNKYVKEGVGKVRVKQGEEVLTVSAGDLSIRFDRATGELAGTMVRDKSVVVDGGPKLLTGQSKFSSMRYESDGDNAVVEARYEGDMHYAKWTVYPSGWVRLDYEYGLDGQFDIMGVSFDYPQCWMEGVRWLGEGPYRVWKNRRKGGVVDVWSKDYNDAVPGVQWSYPEFKGYYSNWRWAVFETRQGQVTIVNVTDGLFLGVYRPKNGPRPKKTRVVIPESGISFLHGIPAIGTKFKKPEVLGPQSAKNKASGNYRGTVYFRFESR